eukprot:TRINITY_DN3336_c0_g1_i3.p1 TRINITY_DN3336_c0_g1~~TRINITY_DN3336_c0_g1_i3.p1  ORF type:complete len:266 (+),score=39.67 TRINITY_DN3336_c0_g1_i3:149-946(+)
MKADLQKTGPSLSQWEVDWTHNNGIGACNMVDVELLDGAHHQFLVDCGWDLKEMEPLLVASGTAELLEQRKLDFLFITHEHMDHTWGIQNVLRRCPDIHIKLPADVTQGTLDLLQARSLAPQHVRNDTRHTGQLSLLGPKKWHKHYPGVASSVFNVKFGGIASEQALYFNVADFGVVCLAGCCHMGVPALFARAGQLKSAFPSGARVAGVYVCTWRLLGSSPAISTLPSRCCAPARKSPPITAQGKWLSTSCSNAKCPSRASRTT